MQLVWEFCAALDKGKKRPAANPLLSYQHESQPEFIYNPYTVLARSQQIAHLLNLMIEANGADFGNIQLFDSSCSALRIVAEQGFGGEFLSYFVTVCSGSFSCGQAMNRRSRIRIVGSNPIAPTIFPVSSTAFSHK